MATLPTLLEALMQPDERLPTLAEVLPSRPGWMAAASCRDRPDVTFFPELGHAARAAREVCAGCPVKAPCLAYALAEPDLAGVWGGTTSRERAALRRKAS